MNKIINTLSQNILILRLPLILSPFKALIIMSLLNVESLLQYAAQYLLQGERIPKLLKHLCTQLKVDLENHYTHFRNT